MRPSLKFKYHLPQSPTYFQWILPALAARCSGTYHNLQHIFSGICQSQLLSPLEEAFLEDHSGQYVPLHQLDTCTYIFIYTRIQYITLQNSAFPDCAKNFNPKFYCNGVKANMYCIFPWFKQKNVHMMYFWWNVFIVRNLPNIISFSAQKRCKKTTIGTCPLSHYR